MAPRKLRSQTKGMAVNVQAQAQDNLVSLESTARASKSIQGRNTVNTTPGNVNTGMSYDSQSQACLTQYKRTPNAPLTQETPGYLPCQPSPTISPHPPRPRDHESLVRASKMSGCQTVHLLIMI